MEAPPTASILRDPVAIVFWAVCALAAIVYASHFVGPLRGWLDRLVADVQLAPPLESPAVPAPAPTGAASADEAVNWEDVVEPKTPTELLPPVQAFARWLELQQNRQGRIVSRLRASRMNQRVVLHVTITDGFLSLGRDMQQQIMESLSRQWSMRCRDQRLVADERLAWLEIFTPDGRVMGSASPQAGVQFTQ